MTYTNEQLALKLAAEANPTRSPDIIYGLADRHLKWLNEKTPGKGNPPLPFSRPPRPAPTDDHPGEGWRNAQWQDR